MNSNSNNAQTVQQIQAIHDTNLQICLPAIESLGRSKNVSNAQPLMDAFATENRPVVRRYIVDALGNLRTRTALPTFKQALADSDVQLRQSAVAAIGLLSSTDVQAALLDQAAHETNPVMKRQLIHHLALLQTPGADKALQTFSQDSDPTVREAARRSLENGQRKSQGN